ncbi:MAG: cardiolipin synthase [Victivallaceae bacterium]|nr:cardiolipin synthase [Victivallaceae bacterium]
MLTTTTIWIISIASLVIGHVVVIIHILLTKHEEPVSAVAWIMAIILSPIIGVSCYLLFGINRLHKMGRRIRLSADLFESDVDKDEIRRFVREMKSFTLSTIPDEKNPAFRRTLNNIFPQTTVTDGNAIQLLKDGSMAYPEMYAAIKNADHSIHLQSYIIMNDKVGRKMFELLAIKAESGVRVKVIYDGVGSMKSMLSSFFMRYTRRHPNLQIRAFSKINIFIPWRIQLRNHRKLLVIDGKVAFIGGINISAGNLPNKKVPKRRDIHDLHCRINGPAVTELQKNFLRDWTFTTKKELKSVINAEDFQEPVACGNNRIRIVDSGPGQNYKATEKMFLAAAATAQKSIIIMTPYFVPNHNFVSALSMAAARGVEVSIIVPEKNDNVVVRAASHSIYKLLMTCGIKIYEKHGMFSHIKAMLIDDKWSSMGSSNCDVRSFKLNYELDFCVEAGDFIDTLRQQLNDELKQSVKISLKDERHKNVLIKLFENICSLFTPIL